MDALSLRRICVVHCKYCKKKRSVLFYVVSGIPISGGFPKFAQNLPPQFPSAVVLPLASSCEYIGQGISLGAWGVKPYNLIMPRTATLTLPKEITGAKGVLDL